MTNHLPILCKVFAIAGLLGVSGCCLTTSISMDNQTGHSIRVFSGQREQTETMIEVGKTRQVPHVVGTIKIKTDSNTAWRYQDIDVPSVAADAPACKEIGGLFHSYLRLHMCVQSDGRLFVMPRSWSARKQYLSSQPVGFPLCPTTTAK
jgi:hypothetical protein